ncbi:hypothetical protein J2848_005801 [Azospirillum lipoferum]|uniref:Uncharacterized protein n=1 Tax=Azospirillum lipoferum TaxID=193 RepID=A0A5A9GIZ1_AZOLI|nr:MULTISPECIES: hypothetical protein [Azospirillum]KAA0593835.1 hypothetical protein FZ942_23450 [Azospirillum lipoferum]MCP1614098.1 hypothetical protein [Azospirillum lipoferum]MDW5536787.1 hypothetical protein [Azospirillum sp. NL1]
MGQKNRVAEVPDRLRPGFHAGHECHLAENGMHCKRREAEALLFRRNLFLTRIAAAILSRTLSRVLRIGQGL